MAKKVYVNVTTRLIINLEEGEDIDNVISDMNYDFNYCPNNSENCVIDTEIINHEIIELK